VKLFQDLIEILDSFQRFGHSYVDDESRQTPAVSFI